MNTLNSTKATRLYYQIVSIKIQTSPKIWDASSVNSLKLISEVNILHQQPRCFYLGKGVGALILLLRCVHICVCVCVCVRMHCEWVCVCVCMCTHIVHASCVIMSNCTISNITEAFCMYISHNCHCSVSVNCYCEAFWAHFECSVSAQLVA